MKKLIYLIPILLLMEVELKAQNAFTKIKSENTFEETVKKLQTILLEKGLKVFSVIDHAEGAKSVAMELRPTTLILFGNPAMGSKLMQCDQRVGVDLPMKYLVWKEADGVVWIGYTKPIILLSNYSLEDCEATINKMNGALSKFATVASQ